MGLPFALNPIKAKHFVKNKAGKWIPKKSEEETLTMHHAFSAAVPMATANADGSTTEGLMSIFSLPNEPLVLDNFVFGTENADVFPVLTYSAFNLSNNYDGQLFKTYHAAGRGNPDPSDIAAYTHDYFEIGEYNPTDNRYYFMLKKPIILPTGGSLGFKNISTTVEGRVHYKAVVRSRV